MAVVLPSPVSILRSSQQSPPILFVPPSSSAASTSSTSASASSLRRSSLPSRRIRFAPFPETQQEDNDDGACTDDESHNDGTRDSLDTDQSDDHSAIKETFGPFSPTISPAPCPSPCSTQLTRTLSPQPPSRAKKLLQRLPFFRRSQPPIATSSRLPPSPAPTQSSFPLARVTSTAPSTSSSASTTKATTSPKPSIDAPPRDVRGSTLPFFRRSSLPPRGRSPPPPPSSSGSSSSSATILYRPTSHMPSHSPFPTEIREDSQKRDSFESAVGASNNKECESDDYDYAVTRQRRCSSSASSPGAGGGRHSFSTKMLSMSSPLARPSTAPSPPTSSSMLIAAGGGGGGGSRGKKPGKPMVKMLNGRVYGAKRRPVHTNTNPFASARDEPEFVEWGYGGMGSVRASADVGSSMWRGLHGKSATTSPTNGTTVASTNTTAAVAGAGGGRGGAGRRRMTQAAPECGMGNVSVGGGGDDDDDGSGLGWVKKRRAEREAKAKAEQEAKERAEREAKQAEEEKEPRKSGESMSASTVSTSASSGTTAMTTTSGTGTDATPSPVTSTSTSVTDLSSPMGTKDPGLEAAPPAHKHQDLPPSHRVAVVAPLNTKELRDQGPSPAGSASTLTSPVSNRDDESDEDEELDTQRKTALGAGVEKVSKHIAGSADP